MRYSNRIRRTRGVEDVEALLSLIGTFFCSGTLIGLLVRSKCKPKVWIHACNVAHAGVLGRVTEFHFTCKTFGSREYAQDCREIQEHVGELREKLVVCFRYDCQDLASIIFQRSTRVHKCHDLLRVVGAGRCYSAHTHLHISMSPSERLPLCVQVAAVVSYISLSCKDALLRPTPCCESCDSQILMMTRVDSTEDLGPAVTWFAGTPTPARAQIVPRTYTLVGALVHVLKITKFWYWFLFLKCTVLHASTVCVLLVALSKEKRDQLQVTFFSRPRSKYVTIHIYYTNA